MQMHILILFSGGLDSLIMRRYAEVNHPSAKITCVWYDLGQEYARKEEKALPDYVIKHKLEWLDDSAVLAGKEGSLSGNIFIPGRNLVLAVNAACKYLPDQIWMGALQGEMHEDSTDKNNTFLEKINDTLAYVLKPFMATPPIVCFPLGNDGYNKLTATKWAVENGVTHERILASSSCLSGEPGNCGKCVVCFRRWGIFKQLGIEGEKYNTHPLEHAPNKDIVREMIFGDHYDEHRRSEILPALPEAYIDKNFYNVEKVINAKNEGK